MCISQLLHLPASVNYVASFIAAPKMCARAGVESDCGEQVQLENDVRA
jgi:hypothetical protein